MVDLDNFEILNSALVSNSNTRSVRLSCYVLGQDTSSMLPTCGGQRAQWRQYNVAHHRCVNVCVNVI